jgi:hypothetical protein
MSAKRFIRTDFAPPYGAEVGLPHHGKVSEPLLREAAQREMAMIRALNPPLWKAPTQPLVREPELPADFATRVAKLDREIVEHGVAVDRSKLLALGKTRFTELLAADREARGEERIFGPRTDFTRWSGVDFCFTRLGALEATGIPARRNAEILSGAGMDREAVRAIAGFGDLWKSRVEPRAVQSVYRFRDVFESLVFGRAMLDRLSDDDRLRSSFFTGGTLRKVLLFRDWIPTLRAPLLSVTIREPLWHLIGWLAGEKSLAPDPAELAREIFGVRAPSAEMLRFAESLMQGFCLGLDGWTLWEYVGRLTRKARDYAELCRWRETLARRFPRIAAFHKEIESFFYRHVGSSSGSYRELDAKRYRLFVDEFLYDRLQRLSLIAALAIDEAVPDCVVARFQSWFLCETAKAPKALAETITAALRTAFPRSAFTVSISEDVTAK